jgi:hypothetical protein
MNDGGEDKGAEPGPEVRRGAMTKGRVHPALRESIEQLRRIVASWDIHDRKTRGAYEPGERIKTALSRCFPAGLPTREQMLDAELVRQVQAKSRALYPKNTEPDRKTIMKYVGPRD